mgnify:CR=1 FL=1
MIVFNVCCNYNISKDMIISESILYNEIFETNYILHKLSKRQRERVLTTLCNENSERLIVELKKVQDVAVNIIQDNGANL